MQLVVIDVDDLEKAIEFYSTGLGLRLGRRLFDDSVPPRQLRYIRDLYERPSLGPSAFRAHCPHGKLLPGGAGAWPLPALRIAHRRRTRASDGGLITRTTRGLTLTEAGTDYLARIEPILMALEEADHAARGTGELRGTLRVSLPLGFGVREVIPRLPAFHAASSGAAH